jgi:hypothetical protein
MTLSNIHKDIDLLWVLRWLPNKAAAGAALIAVIL